MHINKYSFTFALPFEREGEVSKEEARSSRGLGRRPFTAETGVQIPYGLLKAPTNLVGAFLFP